MLLTAEEGRSLALRRQACAAYTLWQTRGDRWWRVFTELFLVNLPNISLEAASRVETMVKVVAVVVLDLLMGDQDAVVIGVALAVVAQRALGIPSSDGTLLRLLIVAVVGG